MIESKLWRVSRQRVEKIHQWRPRRSRVGELVQWDASEHAWLEDRGPKLYLISMIDDASSRLHARFVMHDSTEENMRLLWSYLELHGRPVSYYTDKAALFQTAPKTARYTELARDEREPLPSTQIGRALRELDIVWIGAHSPQADDALIADGFSCLRNASCVDTGLPRRSASPQGVLLGHFEMEAKFLIGIAVPPLECPPEPLEPFPEMEAHVVPPSSIACIMAAMRVHSVLSAASWRRPPVVML